MGTYDGRVTWRAASIVPVWVLAIVGAVVVAVVAAGDALIWLPAVMAVCVVVALLIQLPLGRREGLVGRLGASMGGALVVLAVATLVLALAVPDALDFSPVD
jgi:hypothetical protein